METGLAQVVLSVRSPHCANIPIPWLDPLSGQSNDYSGTQGIHIYSPNRWQDTIRRQLLNKRLTRSQSLSLRIGSRQINFTIRQILAIGSASSRSKHACVDNSKNDAVDSGIVVKHTMFSTKREEEPKSLIPGYEHIVCSLTHDIHEYFLSKERYMHMGMDARQIAYIHGFPGVGKTTVINEALKRVHMPVIYGSVHEMIVNDGGSEPANSYIDVSLNDLISRAKVSSVPAVIFLSHVDALVNSELVQDVAELSNCFVQFLHRLPPNVFVVLESSVDMAKMPGAVKRYETKQHSHAVPMPRLDQRKEIVSCHLGKLWPDTISKPAISGPSPKDQVVARIANAAAGYVARDIAILCRQAGLCRLRSTQKRNQEPYQGRLGSETVLDDHLLSSMSRLSLDGSAGGDVPIWDDFAQSLAIIRPSQQIEFESERPTKRWSDIGGYAKVVEKLKQSMQLATRETSTRLGVRVPRGILLHGPSGCGKTAMALAMISESGCSVISIRSSELFSKYLGETEARLRRLFAAARAAAPCIVFIDEVDSLAARRSMQSEQIGGPELRILSTLLNEMDGIHGTSRVVVVGCTNKISQIDDAILRPGRFDQHIEVGLPTESDRMGILETLGRKSCLADDIDIGKLALSTKSFTGAALEQLFREAGLSALRRKDGLEADVIEMRDFEIGLERISADQDL